MHGRQRMLLETAVSFCVATPNAPLTFLRIFAGSSDEPAPQEPPKASVEPVLKTAETILGQPIAYPDMPGEVTAVIVTRKEPQLLKGCDAGAAGAVRRLAAGACGGAGWEVAGGMHRLCGSNGSRLHAWVGGTYWAYAQWPSREALENAEIEGHPTLMEARKKMVAACESMEVFGEGNVVRDLFVN